MTVNSTTSMPTPTGEATTATTNTFVGHVRSGKTLQWPLSPTMASMASCSSLISKGSATSSSSSSYGMSSTSSSSFSMSNDNKSSEGVVNVNGRGDHSSVTNTDDVFNRIDESDDGPSALQLLNELPDVLAVGNDDDDDHNESEDRDGGMHSHDDYNADMDVHNEQSEADADAHALVNLNHAEEEADTCIAKGGVSTPFPWKLHIMLDAVHAQGDTNVVSWLPHGKAFIVRKSAVFVNEIMHKFFNQSKYASFQRQLNLYGFQRIQSGPDKGAYWHTAFIRGHPNLCKAMIRQKIKGTKVRGGQTIPEEAPDFYNDEMLVVAPSQQKSSTGTKKKTKKGKSLKGRKGAPSASVPKSKSTVANGKTKTKTTKIKKNKKAASTIKNDSTLPQSKTAMEKPSSVVSLMQTAQLPVPTTSVQPQPQAQPKPQACQGVAVTRRAVSNESFQASSSTSSLSSNQKGGPFLLPRTISPQQQAQQHQTLYASFLHAAVTQTPPITAKGGDKLFFEGLPFRYLEHLELVHPNSSSSSLSTSVQSSVAPISIAPRPSSLSAAVSAAMTATAGVPIAVTPQRNKTTVPPPHLLAAPSVPVHHTNATTGANVHTTAV